MNDEEALDQMQLTELFCERPQNFAWFLGAGVSRSAGLPTATDILWDLKRRYYCRQENQDISRQDVQNEAVRDRVQSYVESKGFPAYGSDGEYSIYFEKIFGQDKERQRRYLKSILAEDRVSLAVGHRVLGALMAAGLARTLFTTNFDSVIEKAVAEVSGRSVAPYHLEGSVAANQALNNEEYPLYCKLHGDFRYDNLKNLPDDIASQNEALSQCLVNAGNRFGFVVSGYSGRDASVMALFHRVLETPNPFPNGLFWTEIKGFDPNPAVEELLRKARTRGVNAHAVPIETFDALLLRIWRNVANKPAGLDEKVRKSRFAAASIPLPATGSAKPVVRLNALPILAMPHQAFSLSFKTPPDWNDLRQARHNANGGLILLKTDTVWCWGNEVTIRTTFGDALSSVEVRELPSDFHAPENLVLKGFIEEGVSKALAHGKPLLSRTARKGVYLIANPHATQQEALDPLVGVVGEPFGEIAGLFAPAADQTQNSDIVRWAEAVRVSLSQTNGVLWLRIDPDIWIWPRAARRLVTDFLDRRQEDRLNRKFNALLDAWVRIVLGTDERNAIIDLPAFDVGEGAENPAFRLGSRTAFTRRGRHE